MKKKIVFLILFCFVLTFIFFQRQEVSEGYFLSQGENNIRTISLLKPGSLKGKSEAEMNELYKFKGIHYKFPVINRPLYTILRQDNMLESIGVVRKF